MRLRATFTPDIASIMRDEFRAGERGVQRTMAAAGETLKARWRAQIVGSGLGQRLSRSIRSQAFPRSGESMNAAALVWSKAPKIIGTFDQGTVIRGRDGLWLAIPTEAAGRGRRGKRDTPLQFERRTGLRLRFVYRRRGPSLLVADGRLNSRGKAVASRSKTGRGRSTVPIFILVRQVTLRKRLDLQRDALAVASTIPGGVVEAWGRAAP